MDIIEKRRCKIIQDKGVLLLIGRKRLTKNVCMKLKENTKLLEKLNVHEVPV